MSLKVEKQEKSTAVLTIERPAEELDNAIKEAYNKVKNQITLPGFRKGRVPLQLVEKSYGADIFNEDAAEIIVNKTYRDESKDSGLEIASNPEITIVQVEKGKPFIYTAKVALKPEVKLGKYKGIEYRKEAVEVTEDEVNKEIDRVREMNSRLIPVEDRPTKKDDQVNIDFEGFVDGKAFEGGKAEGHTLTLGVHSFIDTFEEQIEGHNVGDEFDVNVTFPEKYHSEELAGKPATFKVKLNEIKVKELPEADDEFAAEVSEFETLDEYKESVKKELQEQKEGGQRQMAEEEIMNRLIHTSDVEIPELMLKDKVEDTYRDYSARLEQQGISVQQYLQMVNQTVDDLKKEIEPIALKDLKRRLILEAVGKAENIEITDDDVEKEIEQMAEAYSIKPEDIKKVISPEGMAGMKDDILIARAADFIYDNGAPYEGEQKAVEGEETKAKEEVKEEAASEEKEEA